MPARAGIMKDESWLALAAVGGVPPAGSPGAAPGAPVNNRPKPFLERLLAYRLLLVLAAAVLALDQASKFWIAARLPFGTYGPPAALTVRAGLFLPGPCGQHRRGLEYFSRAQRGARPRGRLADAGGHRHLA